MNPRSMHAVIRPTICLSIVALAVELGLPRAWGYRKDALNIYVQSSAEDHASRKGEGAAQPATPRGKVYFLAPPVAENSRVDLIKPVDASRLEQEVQKVLQAKGYRPAVQGETPDMTITVLYGRGWIHNPYRGPNPGVPSDDAMAQDWSVRDVIKVQNSGAYVPFSTILQLKSRRFDQEKLAIIVTAWEWDPPAMRKHQAKRLWRTIMYIDDPDHRDLNNIADKLLAVGADYFDRETAEPEVEATKPLPEGRVEIGTEKVLGHPDRQTQ